MITAETLASSKALEARVRSFVAGRVRSPADVDDIVQEVFLRMHVSLATLRDPERLGPWLYRVARNAIVDHQRRRVLGPLPDEDVVVTTNDDADRDESSWLTGCLPLFLARLPELDRRALALTELVGHSRAETAKALGLSTSGAKSRVQRAREKLRKALEECCSITLDRRGGVRNAEPRDECAPSACACGRSEDDQRDEASTSTSIR